MDRINGMHWQQLLEMTALRARRVAGALLLGLTWNAQAAVVNQDTAVVYESFAEAYSASNNGETLVLDDGVYALSEFALNKQVNIRAQNLGGALIRGNGIATGFPIVITAETTLSGLRFSEATAAFSLRDQDITVRVEDAVFHGMNHGVTHQNIAGGTVGQIIITRATFYDLVEEAVYVNNGGTVQVSDAVFVDLPALGLLLGDNEDAATLQISDYALANTANTVNNPALATLSGLVGGEPVLADPGNGYFALLAGSAGADEGLGIGLAAAPRVTVSVKANGQAIANGATNTSTNNLTDFGSIHVSDSRIHQFSIENEGYADSLSLTQVLGEYVRVSGEDEDQFSILSQPGTDTIAPRSSASFELIYSPVGVGAHQSSVVFNNDLEDPYIFRVSGLATNTAPEAADDSFTMAEDGSAQVTVLGNDTDADGDELVVSSATLISGQGAVSHQPSSVEYVPDADFNGDASIRYVASDGHATDTATLSITVNPVNDAPVAVEDHRQTDEDTLLVIDVLSNDQDVDGDVLTLISAEVASGGGAVTLNGDVLEYRPAADSTAEASLRYVVSDGALSDTGSVFITIQGVNDAPTASADSASTAEDTPVLIDVLANDTDVDGDALSLSSAAVESGGGSVVIRAGQLEFSPAANSVADVTLSYVVSDGELTDSGSVSVSISPVNDAPVAVADSASTQEDTRVLIDVLANDTDVDGDALTISSAAVESGGGSIVINGDVLEYTPDPDITGTANLSYVVSDGELSDAGSVTVTIAEANDAPVAADDSATTTEDTRVLIDVLANDSDPDGDALSLSGAAVESGGGSVLINGAVLEFTPAADSTAEVALSYVVSDGSASAEAAVVVTITPVNDAPVAVADSSSTAEDTPVLIDVLANDTDVDGDGLSLVSAAVESGGGSVVINGGVLEFSPAANSVAAVTLSYVVTDGELTDAGSVSVSINPVNDAPVATADSTITQEDTSVLIDVLANDTDIDGDALTISSAVVQSGGGHVVVSGGVLEYTPAANSTEGATLSYVVSDGELTDSATVSVTVTAVNDAPVANSDSASTDEDTPVLIDVLANDADVDGDALNLASAAVESGGGSVVIRGGVLEFSPAANSVAAVTLSYVVTDGELTDSGSVSVTINQVNDAPVANADSASTDEDTRVLIDVLANDTDIDGDALTISSAAVESGGGRVVVSGGVLEYTPAANSTEGATLSYVLSDGELSDTATVAVTVTPVNDAPVANADSASTDEDTSVLIDVLANDSDPEGDALSLVSAELQSGGGSVVISGGLLEFTPATNSTADVLLSYVVSDGDLNDTGSVLVSIRPVNDAPVASADSAVAAEDTTALIDVLANDTDIDGDALTISSAAVESGSGRVVIGDGVLEYTPAANSTEGATLSYVLSDGDLTDTATVSVTVTPVNDAPVASADSASTNEDTSVLIDVLANDTDIDGDALTISSAAVESGGGRVVVSGGLLEYTPADNSTAGATLRYVMSDGELTDSTTVSVTVTAVNDAPVAVADSARGHYLDEIEVDPLANDVDVDGDRLTLTAATTDRGTVEILNNQLIYRAGGTWVPQATIAYTVSDGSAQDSAAVIIDLDEYQGPLVIGSGEDGAENGALADASFGQLYSIVVGINGQLFAADGHVLRGINIQNNRSYSIIDNAPGHQDGHKDQARFGDVEGMVYDPDNASLYISEVSKGTIRRFDLRRDTVNTIRRGLSQPIGMALSNDRNTLYVIEHGKARVLSLNLLHGEDSVLVGSGTRGFADGVGEQAQIDVSVGLTVGPDGTIYLADRGNGRVRAIDPESREIRTLSDDFVAPTDVAVRDADTLMVLDRSANQIKRLDLGSNEVSVLASSDGELLLPVAMSIDEAGTLYVADTGHHQIKAFSIEALERTHSAEISTELEGSGDTQQGDYFVTDLIGNGHPGVISGRADLVNLFDPDQVVIAGEDIVFNSSRQFTLMRTNLKTGETAALFPDYASNTLIDATAYGLGVSRWGHIDGMAYSAADNRLYVFAGRNTLFTINLDDNSFQHVTVLGLVTGGDFTLAFDGSLYMADTGGNRIVQIDPQRGELLRSFDSTSEVPLSAPTDVAMDSSGQLYVANWGRREVVKLDPGSGAMSHFIFRNGGYADGHLGSAVIGGVYGLEMGEDDVLYLADRLNHAIRMVDTQAESPVLLTLAGDSAPGLRSDNGARFNNPTSLAVDKNGALVVTDDGNHRIRLISKNPSAALIPFDTGRDILGTNEDGSPVEEGTLPLGEFPIIRNNGILQAAVAPLPMLLVDADEREQTLGEVHYQSLEGDVSLQLPAGLNGASFTVHGARLLVFSRQEAVGEELQTHNSFFIKLSMRRFALSWLVALDQYSSATSRELRELVSLLPDVQMLIAYSDKNLDAQAINTLPQNLQAFFAGIFAPSFGIPIFNANGSIHAFHVANFDSLPSVLRNPLGDLGIDAGFLSNALGLNSGLLSTVSVDNIGTLIDALMVVFPSLRAEVHKDSSDFSIPSLSAGLILPGLSLPAFMQDTANAFPLFQIIGFEPDPSVQLRYFLSITPDVFAGAQLSASAGVEGALRANMPNILNANALREAPGTEPLDLRVNLTAAATVAAGLTDGSVGIGSADVGIKGSLQLVNYWNNPWGIQGIGFGNASILVGGDGAVGAALENVGAGVNLFAGLSGEMACLDQDNEIIGIPENAAVYLGFKIGVPPLPTGVGLERSGGPGGMTVAEQLRCRARIFNSVVLGMGDTLLGALPEGPERDAIASIQATAADSFAELEQILFAPLDLAPIRHLFDGARFKGNLYFATPGVELPGRFGNTGLESSGRIEVRDNLNAPWIEIADAAISITFAKGLSANFGLHDYNIADLIVMENVQGDFAWPFHNPLAAKLNLTGSQTFFDLQSDTKVAMSIRDGVTIDSATSISNLGEVAIVGASTGSIANWPPLGPGGGIDFAGEARFDLDTNHVADQIHGAVNHVLNNANSAYRDALTVLSSRSREEQDLQRQIEALERQISERTREINDRLRPGFEDARRKLDAASRHVSNVWSDIRYFERRKQDHERHCGWQPWTWDDCAAAAYWWGREKAARGLVWGANKALDLAKAVVRGAESELDGALYKLARTLSPRLNALRLAIVGLRTSRDLAALTVRALQAANSEVQSIGNALRDAGNVQVHDASARIDSLFNVYAGIEGLRTHLDIEVLNLRCSSALDVNLNDPVRTLMGGIQEIQRACVADLHEGAHAQRTSALQKQYFASKMPAFASAQAAAGNDEPGSATRIDGAAPLQLSADNSGAGSAPDEYASELTDHTLWWRWQPELSGVYRISAGSGATDTTLQLHRAVDGAPTAQSLVAADFIPAASAELRLRLDASQEYLIGVGSQLGLPGPFSLSIDRLDSLPVAANDDLADAVAITGLGGSSNQNNLAATVEAGEGAGDALPINASVWWRLDVSASGLYTVNTLGSVVDTVLRAYRADGNGEVAVGNLIWQKTADDISIDPRSELTLFAEAGERLWFSVGSKDANGGQIAFNWQHTALDATQLQGDDFAEAIVLDAASSGAPRSNIGATTEPGEPLHAAASNAASLWYRYTAPENGNYLFDTQGSALDTALAIYAGEALEALTELASSDGSRAQSGLLNSIPYSAVRVNLQAGQTYYLALAGLREAEGDLVLNVQRFVLNDAFENPLTIPVSGGHYSTDLSQAQLQAAEPDYAQILATDFLPERLLASLTEVSASAQASGVDVPVDDELIGTLQSLYEDSLAGLQSRPAQHSLWYRYTATQSGDLQLDTFGSEPDTVLVVFVGDELDTLQALAWNDDIDNGTDSRLRHPVAAGSTYFIALMSRSAGVVRLNATLVTPEQQNVANDAPETAIVLAAGAANQSADNTYAEPSEAPALVLDGQDGQRLWWRFDATEAGYLQVDTQGSASDTLIEVYQEHFGTRELITFNDNYHAALNSSRVQLAVTAGRSYWIAVDTLNDGAGPVRLNHRFERQAAAPANDRIEQATMIAADVHTVTSSNHFAQHQAEEPALGAVPKPNSVWYRWTPSRSGLATISTQGSEFDTLLGIYLGSQASELQLLESNDDAGLDDASSLLRVHVVAGVSYQIAIAGKRDVQGRYTLNLSVADDGVPPAQNTSAATAELIGGPAPRISTELRHALPEANTGSDLVEPAGQEASSRWWRWQAPETGQVEVFTQGSEVVPQLEMYRGDSASTIVLLATDKGSGNDGQFSRLSAAVTTGHSYYVRVSSPFSAQGALQIEIAYTGQALPGTVQQLPGDSGRLPAAITAAGTRAWTWTATDQGLMQFSLSRGGAAQHALHVYRLVDGARLAVDNALAGSESDASAAPQFQFEAEKGARYRIEVLSTQALLGNAELHYSYANRKRVDMAGSAGRALIESLASWVVLSFDDQHAPVLSLAASPQTVATLLAPLLAGSGIEAEQLTIELSVGDASSAIASLADLDRLRVVARDRISGEILISAQFDPGLVDRARQGHDQVLVDSPRFTELHFAGSGGVTETVGVQMGRDSFNALVAQAFVSVEQLELGGQRPNTDLRLLLGAQAYQIDLDLYDSSGQRYPLEDDASVLRSVQVRLPIDTEVLLAWLELEAADLDEAQRLIDLAIAQGILKVYRADAVDGLLTGQSVPVSGDLGVDLRNGQMYFSTNHFSVFGLVAEKSATEIGPAPEEAQDFRVKAGALDWVALLVLWALWARRRGRASTVQGRQLAFWFQNSTDRW